MAGADGDEKGYSAVVEVFVTETVALALRAREWCASADVGVGEGRRREGDPAMEGAEVRRATEGGLDGIPSERDVRERRLCGRGDVGGDEVAGDDGAGEGASDSSERRGRADFGVKSDEEEWT